MSWDATLVDDRGHTEVDVNYTHNTNGMIAEALRTAGRGETPMCDGPLGQAIGPAWWRTLDGMTGLDGRDFLAAIVAELEREPAKYEAMNPENGWGSYETLLPVLRKMRDAVPDWPTTWKVWG
jgi:hypothetical protein